MRRLVVGEEPPPDAVVYRMFFLYFGGNEMEAGKKTDTIAAIATAMGSSGIGIVRISGSEAI